MTGKPPTSAPSPSRRSRKAGPERAAARRAARLSAVQALYQMHLGGMTADQVIDQRLSGEAPSPDGEDRLPEGFDTPDLGFYAALVRGVARGRVQIDERIAAALTTDWSVARLELLVRLILEAAVYELTERGDIPPRVVINEYLDMAHAFFDGPETALINGVLDSVARAFRAGEMSSAVDPRTRPA